MISQIQLQDSPIEVISSSSCGHSGGKQLNNSYDSDSCDGNSYDGVSANAPSEFGVRCTS